MDSVAWRVTLPTVALHSRAVPVAVDGLTGLSMEIHKVHGGQAVVPIHMDGEIPGGKLTSAAPRILTSPVCTTVRIVVAGVSITPMSWYSTVTPQAGSGMTTGA